MGMPFFSAPSIFLLTLIGVKDLSQIFGSKYMHLSQSVPDRLLRQPCEVPVYKHNIASVIVSGFGAYK